MNISILSVKSHPINPRLMGWCDSMNNGDHTVEIFYKKENLKCGDLLFIVSFPDIISSDIRSKFGVCLVPHGSALPQGRGWSPIIWYVLQGHTTITLSLIEAQNPVDTGDIWITTSFELQGHELFDEINEKIFTSELYLMTSAVQNLNIIVPTPQTGDPGEYFRKRKPYDSVVDINLPLVDQINLLRVADPNRYPAYFKYLGHKYTIVIKKCHD